MTDCFINGSDPEKILDWYIKQEKEKNAKLGDKWVKSSKKFLGGINNIKDKIIPNISDNSHSNNFSIQTLEFKLYKQVQIQKSYKHPLEYLNENNGDISSLYLNTNLNSDTYHLVNNLDIKENSCRMMICHIFFSDIRTNIYIKKMLQIIKNLKLNLKSYYDTKKNTGQKIIYFDSLRFFVKRYHETSLVIECKNRVIRRTPALPINEKFIKEATKVIMDQWKILCLTPWGLENASTLGGSFLSHILAILNYLGKGGGGQRVGKDSTDFIEIIPESKYANKYWPPNTDFMDYNLDKNMITIGTNHLTYAYNSIKKAKLQIPTNFLSLTVI
jgi:hypothetical protein